METIKGPGTRPFRGRRYSGERQACSAEGFTDRRQAGKLRGEMVGVVASWRCGVGAVRQCTVHGLCHGAAVPWCGSMAGGATRWVGGAAAPGFVSRCSTPNQTRPGAYLQHTGHQQRQHWRVRCSLQDEAAHAQHDEHAVQGQLGKAIGANGPARAAAAVVAGVHHFECCGDDLCEGHTDVAAAVSGLLCVDDGALRAEACACEWR
jgi:hypothetical protein